MAVPCIWVVGERRNSLGSWRDLNSGPSGPKSNAQRLEEDYFRIKIENSIFESTSGYFNIRLTILFFLGLQPRLMTMLHFLPLIFSSPSLSSLSLSHLLSLSLSHSLSLSRFYFCCSWFFIIYPNLFCASSSTSSPTRFFHIYFFEEKRKKKFFPPPSSHGDIKATWARQSNGI